MANNSYTDNMSDGQVLTDAKIDTALTTLKLDLSNTDQMTQGAPANAVLTATTPGAAATWVSLPGLATQSSFIDLLNAGLLAQRSGSNVVFSLRNASGSVPNSTSPVVVGFHSTGTTTSNQELVTISGAKSATFAIGSSATYAESCYVYLFKNGSTADIAVSARSNLDCGYEVPLLPTTSTLSTSVKAQQLLTTTTVTTAVCRLLGVCRWNVGSSAMTSTRLLSAGQAFNYHYVSNGQLVAQNITTTSFAAVTNLSATIVTVRPTTRLRVSLNQGANTIQPQLICYGNSSDIHSSEIQIRRGTLTINVVANMEVGHSASFSPDSITRHPISLVGYTTVSAGTHTFNTYARLTTSGGTLGIGPAGIIIEEVL